MPLKTVELFLLNERKKISLTKVGAWAVVLAGATLSILAGPAWLLIVCKYIVALGSGTAACGLRNAMGPGPVQGPGPGA